MTNKQYLIDITLISLDVGRLAKPASKIMCQIHYGDGDSYLRIKLQPMVKNGIASFYEQRIRIPYSSQIALVFKMFRVKKQIFLGHYTIEIQKYLQQKIYTNKLKQKLEENDAWIDFQIKIIDKQLFCDQQSDDLDDQGLHPTARSQYSQQQKSKANLSDYKAKSDLNTPFLIIKKQQNLKSPLLPQEFSKLLLGIQDLLKKYRIIQIKSQQQQLQKQNIQIKKQIINKTNEDKNTDKNNRNSNIKTSTIIKLQAHLQQAKKNQQINTYILWLCVALAGFFLGMALK